MSDLSLVTHTKMPEPAPLKRVAIIGTAQSWKACPWHDTSLEVWGLNDAYLIGVPRANRWYDLHPVHQMLFRPPNGHIDPASVPAGVYVRPADHLQWLKSRPMPVYLAQGRSDWPTSQTFPRQAILDAFAPYWPMRLTRQGTIEPGPDYEVSTPSWMLMHAIVEGYQEIHIYGIHLATEWEYLQQRPNFEFLMGIAAGKGIKLVLPQSTPICKAGYRYAFEPKIDVPLQRLEQELQATKQRGAVLQKQLSALPWYARQRRQDLTAQLQRLNVIVTDTRQAQSRVRVQMENR